MIGENRFYEQIQLVIAGASLKWGAGVRRFESSHPDRNPLVHFGDIANTFGANGWTAGGPGPYVLRRAAWRAVLHDSALSSLDKYHRSSAAKLSFCRYSVLAYEAIASISALGSGCPGVFGLVRLRYASVTALCITFLTSCSGGGGNNTTSCGGRCPRADRWSRLRSLEDRALLPVRRAQSHAVRDTAGGARDSRSWPDDPWPGPIHRFESRGSDPDINAVDP